LTDLPARIEVQAPGVLLMALDAAVPWWMVQLSLMTKTDRLTIAQADAMLIADHLDTLDTADVLDLRQDVFSALARAIAFGALNGGVWAFGRRWGGGDEVNPPGPETEPVGT